MTFPEEIYSSCLKTPGRAFFFDVKKRHGQTKRLVMTQTRNGIRERLTVYEEEIGLFVAELMKAVAAMGEAGASAPGPVDRYAEVRKTYPKAYTPWTNDDDAELVAMDAQGASVAEMVERFGRQPGAIRSRLAKLAEDQRDTD